MSRIENETTVAPKLHKRSDKKNSPWYCTVRYRKPGNTGRRSSSAISTHHSDKRMAEAAKYKILQEFKCRLYEERTSNSDKQPLGECVQIFLNKKRVKAWAAATENEYRTALEQFASPSFLSPDLPICQVTTEHCEEFVASRNTPHMGYKAAKALRKFFSEVTDKKNFRSPVTKALCRDAKPEPVIQDYFHEELGEFPDFYSRLPESTHDEYSFKQFAYLAQAIGVRLEDLSLLRESDIHYAYGIILIKKQGKQKHPVRCYISPQVEDALALQRGNKARHEDERVRESEYVFPNGCGEPYNKYYLSHKFTNVRRSILPERGGLGRGEGLHAHSLRHSFGQNAANYCGQFFEISVAMGHSNPNTTLDSYAQNVRYVEPPEHYATLREYLWSRPVLSQLSSSSAIIS